MQCIYRMTYSIMHTSEKSVEYRHKDSSSSCSKKGLIQIVLSRVSCTASALTIADHETRYYASDPKFLPCDLCLLTPHHTQWDSDEAASQINSTCSTMAGISINESFINVPPTNKDLLRELRHRLVDTTVKCSERCLYQSAKWLVTSCMAGVSN